MSLDGGIGFRWMAELDFTGWRNWISLDGRIGLSLQAKRDQMAEAALFKKDPDAYQAKMEAMEAARMRMQARHDEVRGEVNYKYGHDQGTHLYVHNE